VLYIGLVATAAAYLRYGYALGVVPVTWCPPSLWPNPPAPLSWRSPCSARR
jgi:hypothetical protein